MAGRPEHDPVAGRFAETGVGGAVVPADVGLELDDPSDPSTGRIVADEARPDERSGRREGRALEEGPLDDAQKVAG
jgi:hypothetical protein